MSDISDLIHKHELTTSEIAELHSLPKSDWLRLRGDIAQINYEFYRDGKREIHVYGVVGHGRDRKYVKTDIIYGNRATQYKA